MKHYDVVIAGAGPAGSMAALVLSRAGKKVLVVEKSHFPRTKVCGYSLNPRSWALWKRHDLAAKFEKLPSFELAGFTLERKGVPILRHRFHGDSTRAVDRAILDSWLADEAQASGATYQFDTGIQSVTSTGVVTSQETVEASLIIGADGRNSVIGRLGGLALPSDPCKRVAWQTYVETSSLDDHVHMNIFPEGYYGMNRIDATRATITLVLFSSYRVTPDEIAARYLPGVTPSVWKSTHPISRRPWQVTNGRCWLVGDAAYALEPLTGEGIYSALATAEMAAKNILSIDQIGIEPAARRYRRQHRRFYGTRTMINSFVRWSLEDSQRSMYIMKGLQYGPVIASRMVDWVQNTGGKPSSFMNEY